ncbi:MAG: alpha-mannosidase [Chloroflexota bacterium]
MALSLEWLHRIQCWQSVLWQLCYRPLGDVAFDGFTTLAQLDFAQALQHKFTATPPGTPWGSQWAYGWFKSQVTVPPAAAGQRIVFRAEPGGEALVWVNGRIAGSFGWGHKEITLTTQARPGETFEILLEAYAGHGRITVSDGPVPHGVQTVPEPGPTQNVMGEATFGIWREPIYQLAIDFNTLYELRNGLDEKLLRTSAIDEALFEATLVFDPELPESELLVSAAAARACLKPLLDSVNGSTMPTLHAFGHAHLDIAWLWPLQETERKMARTIVNQLALFDEYPEYKFLQSQPHLYLMLRQKYPALYERLKEAVQTGRLLADGAMWVESDTNLAGGEALIRQVLYGRRFFRDEFGVDSRVLWLPDVFGYSGALPQILKGCGCTGFATQKITWTYNGGEPFPYNTFWWEGIDGSAIPAHIYTDYTSHTRPQAVFDRWNTRLQKNGIKSLIFAFGWGDGGGGPTRDHLEYLRRAADLEGLPRVEISSPAAFFADLEAQGLPRARYVGELYFQAHRGTYTSQARTKRGNRRAELALREAELWATAAHALHGFAFTPTDLADAWRGLLLCQFHDILPGSSIERVYEEAEATLANVAATADRLAHAAVDRFVEAFPSVQPASSAVRESSIKEAASLAIFNSLNWPRTVLIDTACGYQEATAPACGYTTLHPFDAPTTAGIPVILTQNGDRSISLENEFLRVRIDARGEMISLFDKTARRETLSGPANQFRLYKDVPTNWDAWDLDSNYELQRVATDEPVHIEVAVADPLVAQIRLTRRLSQSSVTQVIGLRRAGRRLEFVTTIDWQEKHRLLKVAFPTNLHANDAIHEIQFGHLRRPNHRSRQYDADRFEVCHHKWTALAEENRGLAVLNDSKYGVNVLGGTIQLTLLKSALAPDMNADRGMQTFTYAVYAWHGSFADCNVVREAYELNVSPVIVPGDAGEGSLFVLDAPNIVLETVKLAEDGSGDIILRLYESKRTATRCTLTLGIPVRTALQTDMTEEGGEPLPVGFGNVALDFRPFEIKTIRLA